MITTDELKRDFETEISVIVLACRVFVGTATEDELATFISTNNIDWQKVYSITRIHQLRPVVFKILYKLEVPKEIKDTLQADCMHIAMHNQKHARELTRIYDQLDKAGVMAIPYKGSMFALEYYKDTALREFSDIDFLINLSIKDLGIIKNAFEQSGYIDKSDVPDDFKETHFKYTREYYFDKYENDKRKFHAEFHWVVASQIIDFPTTLPNSLLFDDLQHKEVYGQKIKLLSDTHHFMALVSHHGLNQRWALMKYIMDLSMILKNGNTLDWAEINAVSKKYGFNKSVQIGLYIADQLLGIKPATPYNAPKDAVNYLNTMLLSLNKDRTSTSDALLLNLKIKDNLAGKLKMILKYINYSATPSILDYKFIKLPRPLYFLYAFIKPIRRRMRGSDKKD
ncbi:MAG: hypothetical protein JWQ38_826 [Flavipsychrobacter sp.]|nr:hypothetical protein [Flavipsychrobacter sp.]